MGKLNFDKSTIPAELVFGYITTTDTFDPPTDVGAFKKRIDYLVEKDTEKKFKGISFQVSPDPTKEAVFLDLVDLCREKGFEVMPIFMCGADTNPLNPEKREAAIENWANFCTAIHKSGCPSAMGPYEEWSPNPETNWGKNDPDPLPDDVVAERIEAGAIVAKEGAKVLPADTKFRIYYAENLIKEEQRTLNTITREVMLAEKTNELLKKNDSPLTFKIIVDTSHSLKLDRTTNSLEGPLPNDIAEALELAAKKDLIGLAHISRPGERDNPLAGGYPLKAWLNKLWDWGLFVRQDIEMFGRFDFLVDNLSQLTKDKCDYDPDDLWTPSIKTLELAAFYFEEWKKSVQ